MDISVTSILQQLRTLEGLVTGGGMTAEEIRLELELRTIVGE